MGVIMKRDIVSGVEVSSGEILHVTMRDGVRIEADHYVFAGGNPAGNMFYSTNKRIEFSPHELLYGKGGVGFIGLNRFMIHPFGRCHSDGKSTVGCLETDHLAGCKILLKDRKANFTKRDTETEDLLMAHAAHYHFLEISARFFNHGGVVQVVNPISGEAIHARVVHHYSQLAFKMQDYVGIEGLNAYAVGDAAGIDRYTGGKLRIQAWR